MRDSESRCKVKCGLGPGPVCFPMLSLSGACALALCLSPQVGAGLRGGRHVDVAEPQPLRGDYAVLDRVEGTNVDLLFAPVNPMVMNSARTVLYAVNSHGSQVQAFDDLSGRPSSTFEVPWGPVSVAYWKSSVDGHEELLVITRGTHGVTRFQPSTGRMLGFLALPPEPAGALVLGDRLYVSCSAWDVVCEVDLLTMSVRDRFEIDTARHLLFLSQAGDDVLVTPMMSGNNTLAMGDPRLGVVQAGREGAVLDLTDPSVAQVGLPDEDVFRLVPGEEPFSGRVEVAATGVGTNLFAHGVHPVTGKLWVLNTEAHNQDPGRPDEPSLRGDFIRNRLTLVDLPARGAPPATLHEFVSLDDVDPATPELDFEPGFALGKPYGLAFADSQFAFCVGASTDNVRILNASGRSVTQWDLPDGSIPRGLLYHEALQVLFVHCWGTNEVRVHSIGAYGNPLVGVLDLGFDPTEAGLRAGRKIFFDADNSRFQNASCESCHVEGLQDFLVWNLSDQPLDDKGPMTTQGLRGIEPTGPFHWRGERAFADFDVAFDGLLGGQPLGGEGGEFEHFQAYIFSLQNPANPFQHPERVLVDDPVATRFDPIVEPPRSLSAVRGQEQYLHSPVVGEVSCEGCHALPTGTVNDMFLDGLRDRGQRNMFVVPGLQSLWRKEQKSRVVVQVNGENPELRPPLGSGTSHAGLMEGVFEFVLRLFPRLPSSARHNIAFFVHQFDSGLAPAVHRAVFVGPGDTERIDDVRSFLLPQARKRNCDVAVLGRFDVGRGLEPMRWAWDRELDLFRADRSNVTAIGLSFFEAQVGTRGARALFVGLPVGMGRRWGIDFDGDDPFEPDFDGDGFFDGTEVRLGSLPNFVASTPFDFRAPGFNAAEVLWATARSARVIVELNEPARIEATYFTDGVAARSVLSREMKRHHSLVLQDLAPSYETIGLERTYRVVLEAEDESGNRSQLELEPFQTRSFITARESSVPVEAVAREFEQPVLISRSFGGHSIQARVRIENRKLTEPAPLRDHVAVVRVLVNGVPSQDYLVDGQPPPMVLGTANGDNQRYPAQGPFLIGSLSSSSGYSTLRFVLPNARPGDEVRLVLETIGAPPDPDSFDPAAPFFGVRTQFDFPSSPPEARVSPVLVL